MGKRKVINKSENLYRAMVDGYSHMNPEGDVTLYKRRLLKRDKAFEYLVEFIVYHIYPTNTYDIVRILRFGGFMELWDSVHERGDNFSSITVGDVLSYIEPYGLMKFDEDRFHRVINYNRATVGSLLLYGDEKMYDREYVYPPMFRQ